jgi:hypothetical protein
MAQENIKNCDSCPLLDEYQQECNHPEAIVGRNDIEMDYDKGMHVLPDWCPLKKGPITITLIEEPLVSKVSNRKRSDTIDINHEEC